VEITRPDDKTVRLARLDSLLTELLRGIPKSADPGDNSAARARLFSAPSHDQAEADFVDDWQQYIEPELRRLFQTTLEVIEEDLQKLQFDKSSAQSSMTIPLSHLESWIHGLNQARLALAARHAFSEEEMERALSIDTDPRALALLQVRFYGVLQELFLRELEGH
jgi:hypothetical protein